MTLLFKNFSKFFKPSLLTNFFKVFLRPRNFDWNFIGGTIRVKPIRTHVTWLKICFLIRSNKAIGWSPTWFQEIRKIKKFWNFQEWTWKILEFRKFLEFFENPMLPTKNYFSSSFLILNNLSEKIFENSDFSDILGIKSEFSHLTGWKWHQFRKSRFSFLSNWKFKLVPTRGRHLQQKKSSQSEFRFCFLIGSNESIWLAKSGINLKIFFFNLSSWNLKLVLTRERTLKSRRPIRVQSSEIKTWSPGLKLLSHVKWQVWNRFLLTWTWAWINL